MARLIAMLAIGLLAVSASGQGAARPTLEDLQKFKEILPMPPEEIVALTESVEVKHETFRLEVSSYVPVLDAKQRAKLQKDGLVLVRLGIELAVTNNKESDPKKRVRKDTSGNAEIFVFDPGAGKLVAKKKESLAKLCPT